jgi:hypothetical protein
LQYFLVFQRLQLAQITALVACLPCSALAGKNTPLNIRLIIRVVLVYYHSFLLGIGVGAEYPCGSVSASEQSEEEGIATNAQHRWLVLATSELMF